MNIHHALLQYNDHAKYLLNRSPNSLRRIRQEVTHFTTFCNIQTLETATEEKVREYFLDGVRLFHWQPATFQTKHNSLRVFFAWCVTHRFLMGNPLQNIPMPKSEKDTPETHKRRSNETA
jgi:site-specific recombinase XerD